MPSAATLDRNWKFIVLGASLLLMVVGAGSTYLLFVTLKPMADEFGWLRAVPSLAYSLLTLGSALGTLLMGYWLDRSGVSRPAMLGAVMIGSGAILTSQIGAAWHLYVAYGVLVGLLGQSTLFAPMTTNITRWFTRGRARAVGVVASGQSLAGLLWPSLFGYLQESIGWRATYLYYGIFAILVMLPASLILLRPPPPDSESGGVATAGARRSGLAGMSPNRMHALLCIGIVCCCIAMAMPLVQLVSHVSDLGYPMARATEMLVVLQAFGFLSAFLGVGFLADRFGALRALLIFSGVQAAMLVLYAFVDGIFGLYVLSAVYGLGFGGVVPTYPLIVREYLPVSEAGRRTSMVILFGFIGMAAGGFLGGWINDLAGSYTIAFLVGFAFNLVNLVIVGGLILRLRPGGLRTVAA